MHSNIDRWVTLEGTRNFRDFGGIKVSSGVIRSGRVYRSDALNLLSEADQRSLFSLKLGAIVDLRADFESAKAPNRLSEELHELQVHCGFLPRRTKELFEEVNAGRLTPQTAHQWMLEQYEILTLEGAPNYRAVFDELLKLEGQAFLFHCTSGKDRTGIFSALLLATLGANDQEIIEDYILTHGRIEPISFLADAEDLKVVEVIMAAAPAYISHALATMRKHYGSVEKYLSDSVGLTAEEQNALRASLVELS